MFKFEAEGVTVTETAVIVSGVWEMGATKRFQQVRVPLHLFTHDSVLEALCEARSRPAEDSQQHEWEQFLLFG